ncbi:unnamed protein product [Spirodela intermedia]|uniref:Pectin acetylesterase n=1 Tax=Spirodela intermedia TaxID=51605 RepID=A0A7I8JJA7_SPIIN|nr:unnamed protein product [Spirodela intermedia]CAA6669502.1 unnamed protein product [Spirodela intermedia]
MMRSSRGWVSLRRSVSHPCCSSGAAILSSRSSSCGMATGGALGWLLLCALLISLRTADGYMVDITYLESAVAKGAVCLDGSPPAYHFSPGFGSGANSWLIQFEGGAWCNNVTSCLDRKNTRLGSSKAMVKQLAVRYCDGSSFTGDVEAVDPATNLHFRGGRIFLAVIEELLAKGMSGADQVVEEGPPLRLFGGGLTAILQCDRFRALLPAAAKVKCLADAGFFVNAKDITGAERIQAFYSDVVATHGSAKNLPSSCTSRLSPGLVSNAVKPPPPPPVCVLLPAERGSRNPDPLFILNAAYDSWQGLICGFSDQEHPGTGSSGSHGTWRDCKLDIKKCSPAQIQTMHGFLKALAAVGNSPSRGFFINSCYAHCQSGMQETWLRGTLPSSTIRSDPGNRFLEIMIHFSFPRLQTIAKAVGDWFHDRQGFQKIDCPYPCDKTCHNRIFE